jgi:hypothetical protein
MPRFNFTDPDTGRKLTLVGDEPPDETTVEAAFADAYPTRPKPKVEGGFFTTVERGLEQGVMQAVAAPVEAAAAIGKTIRHYFPDEAGSPAGLESLAARIKGLARPLPTEWEGSWTGDIARGGGQIVPSIFTGGLASRVAMRAGLKGGLERAAAAKAGTKAGTATALALGSTQEFVDAFDRSIERGDNPNLAFAKSLGYASVAALIENKLGVGRLMKKYFGTQEAAIKALTAKGVAKSIASDVLAGGAEEGMQRAAQDIIVAQTLEPEGIFREAVVGGIVQGGVGAAGQAGRQVSGEPAEPEAPEETPNQRRKREAAERLKQMGTAPAAAAPAAPVAPPVVPPAAPAAPLERTGLVEGGGTGGMIPVERREPPEALPPAAEEPATTPKPPAGPPGVTKLPKPEGPPPPGTVIGPTKPAPATETPAEPPVAAPVVEAPPLDHPDLATPLPVPDIAEAEKTVATVEALLKPIQIEAQKQADLVAELKKKVIKTTGPRWERGNYKKSAKAKDIQAYEAADRHRGELRKQYDAVAATMRPHKNQINTARFVETANDPKQPALSRLSARFNAIRQSGKPVPESLTKSIGREVEREIRQRYPDVTDEELARMSQVLSGAAEAGTDWASAFELDNRLNLHAAREAELRDRITNARELGDGMKVTRDELSAELNTRLNTAIPGWEYGATSNTGKARLTRSEMDALEAQTKTEAGQVQQQRIQARQVAEAQALTDAAAAEKEREETDRLMAEARKEFAASGKKPDAVVIKKQLQAEIQAALDQAPVMRGDEGARHKVVIAIPGDGVFALANTKAALTETAKRVKSLSTETGAAAIPTGKAAKVQPPKLAKKPLGAAALKEELAEFVHEDEKRAPLTEVFSDGKRAMATNGDTLVEVSGDFGVSKNADSFPAATADALWPETKSAQTEPRQVSTEQLWRAARMAQALEWHRTDTPFVDLWANPDGELYAEATPPQKDSGSWGALGTKGDGAVYLGRANAASLEALAAFARKMTSERVTLTPFAGKPQVESTPGKPALLRFEGPGWRALLTRFNLEYGQAEDAAAQARRDAADAEQRAKEAAEAEAGTTAEPEPAAAPEAPPGPTLADKIRSAKVTDPNLYDATLGIPIAAYNGIVEAAALLVEAGMAVQKAIRRAMAEFKHANPAVPFNHIRVQAAIARDLKKRGHNAEAQAAWPETPRPEEAQAAAPIANDPAGEPRTPTDPAAVEAESDHELAERTNSGQTQTLGQIRQVAFNPTGQADRRRSFEAAHDDLMDLGVSFEVRGEDLTPTIPLSVAQANALAQRIVERVAAFRRGDGPQPVVLGNFAIAHTHDGWTDSRGRSVTNTLPVDSLTRLLEAAQPDRSQRGRDLSMLRRAGQWILENARNLNANLVKTWGDALMPDKVRDLLERARGLARRRTNVTSILTEQRETIGRVLNLTPDAPDFNGLVDLVQGVFGQHWTSQEEFESLLGSDLQTEGNLSPEAARALAKFVADLVIPPFSETFAEEMLKLKPDPETTRLWQQLVKAVREGHVATSELLERLARKNGWTIPTAAQKQKWRALVAKHEELNRLPAAQEADIRARFPDREQAAPEIEFATRRFRAVTLEERNRILKTLQTDWSRWTRPVTFTWDGFKTASEMSGELASANLLFTLPFAVKQTMDNVFQSLMHAVTGSLASARQQHLATGRFELDTYFGNLKTGLRDAANSWDEAIRSARSAWRSTTSRPLSADLREDARFFDRIEARAAEHKAAGRVGLSNALKFLGLIRTSFRFAGALDAFSQTLARNPELRQMALEQVALNDPSLNFAEREAAANEAIRDVVAQRGLAMAQVDMFLSAAGLAVTPAERVKLADAINFEYGIEAIRNLGVSRERIDGMQDMLRTIAWNSPETGGIGGVAAAIPRLLGKAPFPLNVFGRFANAIAISTNRMLHWTPLGFWQGATTFGTKETEQHWHATPKLRSQRRVEATIGTVIFGGVLALMGSGLMRIRLRGPKDKEEREGWMRPGGRPFSIEFGNDDGSAFRLGFTSGPAAFARGPLTIAGAIWERLVARERSKQKNDQEARAMGLSPGEHEAQDIDLWSLLAAGLIDGVGGGRTVSGALANIVNPITGELEMQRVAGALGGFLPGVPMVKSMERIANRYTDRKLAASDANTLSTMAAMLPDRWTGKQKRFPSVNFFGDPLTQGGLQHIADSLTGGLIGGTGPGEDIAYRAVLRAGYQPAPSPAGTSLIHAATKTYGRMDAETYSRYRLERGQTLKAEINKQFNESSLARDPRVIAAHLRGIEQMVEDRVMSKFGYLSKGMLERRRSGW